MKRTPPKKVIFYVCLGTRPKTAIKNINRPQCGLGQPGRKRGLCAKFDGNCCGAATTRVLKEERIPQAISTSDFGTPNAFAITRISCVLAFPSTGAALIRICTAFARNPTISSCLARGWMCTLSMRELPCQRYADLLIQANASNRP